MRNSRFLLVGSASFLAASLIACNAPLAENCPKPIGVFKPEYSQVAGTCQPGYQPFQLKFEADDPNSTTVTETRFADTVTTETLLKGCELNLKQTLTAENTNTTRMALEGSLAVVDESQLHGTVQRVDFMDDGATVRCSATYEALYTLDGLLLGAAARE
jgi:hypothetical protein